MKHTKTFAILGLGRFGTSCARELSEFGHDVIVVDKDMNAVERISEHVAFAVCADFTDLDQLRQIGVSDCDAAVVASGSQLEESILAVMNLKELKVPYVIAKAKNSQFQQILLKIGADKVIRPEKEMGERVARQLAASNVVDFIELDEQYSLIEIKCPGKWGKKTLKELNLRAQYGINVLGIRKNPNDRLSISPVAQTVLEETDFLMVIADNSQLEKIDSLK